MRNRRAVYRARIRYAGGKRTNKGSHWLIWRLLSIGSFN